MFRVHDFSDKFHKIAQCKRRKQKDNAKLLIFSGVAAFFGAVVALLFSPASGKKNRAFVVKTAKKGIDEIQELEEKAETKVKKIEKDLEGKFEELKAKFEAKVNKKKPAKKASKPAAKKKSAKKVEEDVVLEEIKAEDK